MPTIQSDKEIIEAFLRQETKAVSLIYDFIDGALSRWQGKFSDILQDLRQDIMIKILNSLSKNEFRFDSTLKTFVTIVANHTCIDEHRRRKWFADTTDIDIYYNEDDMSPEQQLAVKQRLSLSCRVLRLLPESCQTLFRLLFKGGLTYKDISAILNKSEAAIKFDVFSCRKRAIKIREKLKK